MTRNRPARTIVGYRERWRYGFEQLESRHLLSIVPVPLIGPVPAPVTHVEPLIPGRGVDPEDGSGQILGAVWEDYNRNRVWDTGEPAAAGVTVYLDLNENGQWDQTEPSTVTAANDPGTPEDETGTYAFSGLAAGTYLVVEVVPEGWTQTYPRFGQSVGGEASMEEGGPPFELTTTASEAMVRAVGTTFDDGGEGGSSAWANGAIQLIDLDAFWADPRFADYDGAGFATVVIDTGIDLDHPFFGPDNDSDGVADRIVYQETFVEGDEDAGDENDHGSNVASIIASQDETYPGVAPGANIIALQVLDGSGTGTFAALEAALAWVVAHVEEYNIASVNMSLSDGGNYVVEAGQYGIGDEMAALAALDVIVVSASGNSYSYYGSQGVAYPASDPNSLSVGAVYQSDCGEQYYGDGLVASTTGPDRITPFSQRHEFLTTIMAPGAVITGANSQGGTVEMQGTSQAAPCISGVAVLAQQMAMEELGRRLTVAEFTTLLRESGDTIHDGDDEDDNAIHTGLSFPRVNVWSFAEALKNFAIPDGCHLVALADGEIVEDVNFGNSREYAPVAAADSYWTYDDAVLEVSGPGVLVNDSDLNEDALFALWVEGPSHGALTLDADGGLCYEPQLGFVGQDSFSYVACDAQGQSQPVIVVIDVQHVPPTEIHGIAWNDADADGIRGAGEPILEGVPVFLDLDADYQYDAGEPVTTTDSSGAYAFRHLTPGVYQVVQFPRDGWEPTGPAPPHRLVAATAGGLYPSSLVALGLNPASEVRLGMAACDGGLDTDPKTGLLYLGGSSLSVFDPQQQCFVDSRSFVDEGGTPLRMRSISFGPDGMLYGVSYGNVLYAIDKKTGQSEAIGALSETVVALEFGPDGTLYGAASDLVTIHPSSGAIVSHIGPLNLDVADLDATPEGRLYATVGGSNTLYEINPATGGSVLAAVFQSDVRDLASQFLVNGGLHSVAVQYGDVLENVDFGSRRSVPEVVEVTPADGEHLVDPPSKISVRFDLEVEPTAMAAAGLVVDGVAALAVSLSQTDPCTVIYTLPPLYDGPHLVEVLAGAVANLDGRLSLPFSFGFMVDVTVPQVTVDTLFTMDTSPGLSGTVDDPQAIVEVIVDGTVYLADNWGNGQWALFDNVIFPDLAPGVYDICAQARDVSGNVGVDTTTGELTIGSTAATLTGTTWYDTDRDGERDPGEPPLAGVRVYLDLDEDGTPDGNEPWLLSGADGYYQFSDLEAGQYVVAEVCEPAWQQTSPGASSAGVVRGSIGPQEAMGNGPSTQAALSQDGRFVVYASAATNLVVGDTNGASDIFTFDRLSGEVARASLTWLGGQANGPSYDPAVSSNGRWIAFTSEASNLVAADGNGASDVFLYDRNTGAVERVSVASGGAEANGDCLLPSISADGRYVAFASEASNLVPGDTNGIVDVFVHDRETGQTWCVSVAGSGLPPNGASTAPAISPDGRWVAFESTASDLVSGDVNGQQDIFVRDLVAGATDLVSVNSEGQQANGASRGASITSNGRWVAFESEATNLSPADSDIYRDVFVFDRVSRCVERVPAGASQPGDGSHAISPVISADGGTVAFLTNKGNYFGYYDVMVYDRATGQSETHVTNINVAVVEGAGVPPAISGDGQSVAFQSVMVFGDERDVNLDFDVFVEGDSPLLAGAHTVVVGLGQRAENLDFGHVFRLPGDATGDGCVDEQDASVMSANWGQSVGGGALEGDFNGDGRVNVVDAALLTANWHVSLSPLGPGGGEAALDSAVAETASPAAAFMPAQALDADRAKATDRVLLETAVGPSRSLEPRLDLAWIGQRRPLARKNGLLRVGREQYLAVDLILALREGL